MRKILVVGAGQSGLQLALGLQSNGYEVTLMSNRTADEIRAGRVMSTQCMFHTALQHERDLQLNFWESQAPKIEGLGASYGLETLSLGRRDFSGPFQDQVIQYRGNDISWRDEWREFAAAIRGNREPIGNGHDGREALRIALAAYASDKKRQFVAPGAL